MLRRPSAQGRGKGGLFGRMGWRGNATRGARWALPPHIRVPRVVKLRLQSTREPRGWLVPAVCCGARSCHANAPREGRCGTRGHRSHVYRVVVRSLTSWTWSKRCVCLLYALYGSFRQPCFTSTKSGRVASPAFVIPLPNFCWGERYRTGPPERRVLRAHAAFFLFSAAKLAKLNW